MSAQDKIKIGQFLGRRRADPDDPGDLLAPGGNLPAENSFLEQYRPEIKLSQPSTIPFQPPPALSTPAVVFRPAQPDSPHTQAVEHTPTFAEPSSHTPADPIKIDDGYANDVRATPVVQFTPPISHSVLIRPEPRQFIRPGAESTERRQRIDAELAEANTRPIQAAPAGAGVDFPASAKDQLRGALNALKSIDSGIEAEKRSIDPIPGDAPNRFHYDQTASQTFKRADDQLKEAYRILDDNGRYAAYVGWPVHTPGDLLLDPTLYAKQIARIGARMQSAGLGTAIIAQFAALQAMNRDGIIFNPLTLAPVPGTELLVANSIDASLGTRKVQGQISDIDDTHLMLSKGLYNRSYGSDDIFPHTVVAGGTQISQNNPVVGAKSQNGSLADNAFINPVKPIVEEGIKARNRYHDYPIAGEDTSYTDRPATRLLDLHGDSFTVGVDQIKTEIKNLFYNPHLNLRTPIEQRPRAGLRNKSLKSDPMYAANFNNGVIPVRLKGENDYGFTTSPEKVTEKDGNVPLSFTDMRPIGGGNKFRTIHFRPFLTNLGESFSPQWNLTNYFGRTDQVATYMSTGRVVNIGFQLVAFSPQDVKDIYQKLHWLTSMVYPQIDSALIMRSGPVVRMRVGNVIDSIGQDGMRGLSGIIQNLDYDYTNTLWELDDGFKVPRNINISLSFLVLHDRPMGIGEHGKFGGIGSLGQNGYVPPEAQVDGERQTKLAQVDDGMSFRAVGRTGPQNYADVASADRTETN